MKSLAIIMKGSIFLFLAALFLVTSCKKVKDHYRIVNAEIEIAEISQGPNPTCLNYSNTLVVDNSEVIGIIVSLEREYYFDENSPNSGIMHFPEGWEGCNEKITSFIISEDARGEPIEGIIGDTTITGIFPPIKNEGGWGCQRLVNDCKCSAGISFKNIPEFISIFNSQDKPDNMFLGPKYDNESLLFFINRHQLESEVVLKLYLTINLSNEETIMVESNELKLK